MVSETARGSTVAVIDDKSQKQLSSSMVTRATVLKILLVVILVLVLFQYFFNVSIHHSSINIFRTFGFNDNSSTSTQGSFRQTNKGSSEKAQTGDLPHTHKNNKTLSTVSLPKATQGALAKNVSFARDDNIDSSKSVTGVKTSSSTAETSSANKTSENFNGTLSDCPPVPPKLVGALGTYNDSPSIDEIHKLNPDIMPGGRYKPNECIARHRVAIIIPYRDREQQLRVLLHNLHPVLKRQQLDYGIYVVELAQPTKFNRAMLMNIGYVEANKIYDFQCYVFHDVDLIPEDDRNIYSCPESPRHMSAAIDKFKYKLPYASIFGGVCGLRKDHMEKINGFSNKFFGWGGEDDDVYNRIRNQKLKVIRYPMNIARYKMIKHGHEKGNKANPQRFNLLYKGKKRFATDGLNSLQYKLLKVEFRKLYTWIYVSINETEVMKT